MDHAGISVISAKPTDNVASVYNNLAFSHDNLAKDDPQNMTVNGSVNININNDTATIPKNNSSGRLSSSSDKAGRHPDDVSHPKRGPSSVDFTMPEKQPRDAPKSTGPDVPYRGMGKEELLRYSSKPLWRNLRYVCISVVLTGWLALLITVVALVLTYPQCRTAQDREWWQKAVIYRVYVRSFLDHEDSDGVGDINGITAKLDYIQTTGANTVSLSPFYKLSSNAPTDTHIVNHTDVHSQLGTLEDFHRLVNETHARGMHITVDFIPNHTSDQHPWFQQSRADSDSKTNAYRSYYVWTEGAAPYNNWQSVYGCSAWETLNQTTGESYLHQFMYSQPDLNLRSDKVKDELTDIMKFWLEAGVDGFYIRDADFLFEDYDLRDDILNDTSSPMINCSDGTTAHAYDNFNHTYTRGESQNLDLLAHWRSYLDDYGNATNRYKILLSDVEGSVDHVMSYYGLFNRDGVDFPLNTFSRDIEASGGGQGLADVVTGWMDNMAPGHWPNWMSGDDRSPRLVDRLGKQLAKSYLLFMTLLPGTPFIYYGDEIGMQGVPLPQGTPIYQRSKAMRSPMLWSNASHHHGFCLNHCFNTWMNQSDATVVSTEVGNNAEVRLDVQAMQEDFDSIYNLFKNVTELRKDNPSFVYGDYNLALRENDIVSFVREFDGEKGYLVAVNFGFSKLSATFTGSHSTIPNTGKVELVSGSNSGITRSQSIGLDPLTLAAEEGVVISWDYEAKEL